MTDGARRQLQLDVTAEGAMYAPDEQYRLLDIARAADQAGVDFIDTTEHILMGLNALHSGQGWNPNNLDHPNPKRLPPLPPLLARTKPSNRCQAVVTPPFCPLGL